VCLSALTGGIPKILLTGEATGIAFLAHSPVRWRALYRQHGVVGFVGEGERKRDRETTGYEPFELHAPIQWAM